MMSLLHKMLSVNLFLKSCFPFVPFSVTIMCYKVMILLQFMLISSFSCRLQNFYIVFFFFCRCFKNSVVLKLRPSPHFQSYPNFTSIFTLITLFTYYSCRFSILVSLQFGWLFLGLLFSCCCFTQNDSTLMKNEKKKLFIFPFHTFFSLI